MSLSGLVHLQALEGLTDEPAGTHRGGLGSPGAKPGRTAASLAEIAFGFPLPVPAGYPFRRHCPFPLLLLWGFPYHQDALTSIQPYWRYPTSGLSPYR